MQFTDLKTQYAALKAEIDARIQRCWTMASTSWAPRWRRWKRRLAAFTGAAHCITVASGTEALLIALMALDLKPGDEVITTPFTFAATAEVIVLLGGKPVFVDIEPDTCNIDASADRGQGHAAHPGHHAGQPVRPGGRHGCHQRHRRTTRPGGDRGCGAELWRDLPGPPSSCNVSTFGATSFFPSKPLGCYGDGGALFTSDDALAQACARDPRARPERRYHHTRVGVGGRMDTLQCAVMLGKLPRFEWELERRQALGARYQPAARPAVRRCRLAVRPDRDCVWAQYTVIVDNRARRAGWLQAAGVPTAVHYPKPLHHQPAYAADCCPDCNPHSIAAGQRVLSLPMSADLSEADQDRVVAALAQACATAMAAA
jgi:UDP-2-acetamido-2-deoxy-ribo-hexuluronate aminotransferase